MDIHQIHDSIINSISHINAETKKSFDACIALSITALQNFKDASGDDGCVDTKEFKDN